VIGHGDRAAPSESRSSAAAPPAAAGFLRAAEGEVVAFARNKRQVLRGAARHGARRNRQERPGEEMLHKVELAPLTGLRFVAAFSILFLHTIAWCTPFQYDPAFRPVAELIGVYGMPLFFVLSGFVIHYNYGSLFRDQPYRGAVREFLVARFARIYPLYFFFFLCGASIDFTVNWIPDAPRAFVSYIVHCVTLTQAWVYKLVVNQKLLFDNGFGLAWSLSCEFFFYLAYLVFVFAILALRRPRSGFAAAAFFAAAVIGVLTYADLHMDSFLDFARAHLKNFLSVEDNPNSNFYRWFFYFSPYVRIWEFVLGCLTAQCFLLVRDRPIGRSERLWGAIALYVALALLLIYGCVYAFALGGPRVRQLVNFFALNFGCAAPLAVVIFCAARYRSAVAGFLALPWVVGLGDISYSIYAVHTWTLRPFIRPPVELNFMYGVDAIIRIALAIALTLIVATATYAIIENPARRYLRARLMRKDTPRAEAPAAERPLAAPAPAAAPEAAYPPPRPELEPLGAGRAPAP
jgi:peptidoglycan/LPS O-acetylase OafA/YrhL